jgi:hypothetical protein
MFNLNENISSWPAAVRGYGTTDPVLGGDNSSLGESNEPISDLTNRTAYLFDRLGRFEDVVIITGAVTIGAASKYKLNYIIASGNLTIGIGDVASFQNGAIIPFKIKCPANKAITFQPTSGQQIVDGSINNAKICACDGEEFKLIAVDMNADGVCDTWLFFGAQGNFNKVGQEDLVRFQPRNSIIANGCRPEISGSLLSRADYPRLADIVLPTAIDDSTWLSSISYRQFWSNGDGSTTMRPPDMRALFRRGLDLGRGIRLGQLDNTPGSYEADSVKVPDGVKGIKRTGHGTVTGTVDDNSPLDDQYDLTKTFDISTGSENTSKNAGFIPIIYY